MKETAVCSRCEKEKDLDSEFYWYQQKAKRQRWCKECMKAYRKAWYRKHQEELNNVIHNRQVKRL